jgi:hypothetical protein
MTLGFTLADRLGARTVPCKVAGCTRTWVQLGGKALALGKAATGPGNATAADDAGAGMCEPCKKKLATLHDKQRRCEIPNCPGTFTWTVQQQLEAFAQHKQPPRGLCADCEGRLSGLEDKEAACVIPGCTRTATISKRAQLVAEAKAAAAARAAEAPAAEAPAGEAPPSEAAAEASGETAVEHEASAPQRDGDHEGDREGDREGEQVNGAAVAEAHASDAMAPSEAKPAKEKPGRVTFTGPMCTPCSEVARRLTDRPVTCGIEGCKRKWIWKADEQIQAFAAGKPNEPPRRMCDHCRASFGKLLDREIRCRTSGCKKTWTWSRFDQLDACVADKPAPKAPSRMCDSCFDSFQKLKDVERPCRKNGCKRTWTDKRGAQLARLVRGKSGDPYPQYCSECQKELGDLADREITCKTEGCTGTWTWSKEQQLAAGVRPEPKEAAAEAPAVVGEAAAADIPAAVEAVPAEAVLEAVPAEAVPAEGVPGEAVSTTGEQPPAAEAEAPAAGESAPPGTPAIAQGPGRGSRKDKRRRRQRQIQPPDRLCHACAEFLKDRKTLEIPCSQCATPIFWPPESQLQSHLGNWATPSLCGACKRDATEAARRAAKEAIRAHALEVSPTHVVAGAVEETDAGGQVPPAITPSSESSGSN